MKCWYYDEAGRKESAQRLWQFSECNRCAAAKAICSSHPKPFNSRQGKAHEVSHSACWML